MDVSIENILKNYSQCNKSEKDNELILKAYNYAYFKHQGQYRQSGEEYITHPLNVAYILSLIYADKETICASLLHDVIEDTDATYEELVENFGKDIAIIVDGVTKITNLKYKYTKEECNAINTRKILTSLKNDIRIMIVKLADRLHNMRTLEYKSSYKQKEKAFETLSLFVPLANSLGIYRIKTELEDLSFSYLKSNEYKNIKYEINKHYDLNKNEIFKMKEDVSKKLLQYNISSQILDRTKSIYSTYKELNKGKKYQAINDLYSLKVIVNNIMECYESLGVIHLSYSPLANSFKDYIASPKTNLYQSLHTTLFLPNESLIQCRIRTEEMNKFSSLGICAYYQKNQNLHEKFNEKFSLIDSIEFFDHSYSSNQEFIKQVKKEILTDKIYVYTPKDDIIELPLNATTVDFAYKIHSDLGKNIEIAIVNGQEVPINTKLNNGDRVKVIKKEHANSYKKLIKSANTIYAKEQIKHSLK